MKLPYVLLYVGISSVINVVLTCVCVCVCARR